MAGVWQSVLNNKHSLALHGFNINSLCSEIHTLSALSYSMPLTIPYWSNWLLIVPQCNQHFVTFWQHTVWTAAFLTLRPTNDTKTKYRSRLVVESDLHVCLTKTAPRIDSAKQNKTSKAMQLTLLVYDKPILLTPWQRTALHWYNQVNSRQQNTASISIRSVCAKHTLYCELNTNYTFLMPVHTA